ncbi:MAG: T9SS type A sorting domain-containing protein [Bacteroidota bacterium]
MAKSRLLSRIIIAVLILIFNINTAFSQINLVDNPSFEILISCPAGTDQIGLAVGWNTPINGGGGNPDLYNVCCSNPSVCGVPLQSLFNTFQFPHSGNGYAGLDAMHSTWPNNFREYIQRKLSFKLSNGHNYCVTFYASLSNQSNAYIKTLGAFFDNGSISAPAPHGLAIVSPQVYNNVQSLNDTLNWMKIEGSFDATGNEEYITIGNFFSDSNSGVGIIGTPSSWYAYYYIDDVSVIDADLDAHAGNDTTVHTPGDSIFIGRPPEVGLNDDCIWFVNGQPIDTIAGMWVKPDTTTTYVLQQTICGNVKYDTVTVTVSGVGVGEYGAMDNQIHLFPNPANNFFTLQLLENTTHATLTIYDLLGKAIQTLAITKQVTVVDINALAKGVYIAEMKAEKGVFRKKFLKE